MVVLSLSTVTFLATPRSWSWTFSSLMPRSSVMALPPVMMAMSCSMALRRSPNPGAFADLVHRFRDDLADGVVVVGRDGADLRDHVAGHGLGELGELATLAHAFLVDRAANRFNRLLDAALHGHRVRAGGNRLHAFA